MLNNVINNLDMETIMLTKRIAIGFVLFFCSMQPMDEGNGKFLALDIAPFDYRGNEIDSFTYRDNDANSMIWRDSTEKSSAYSPDCRLDYLGQFSFPQHQTASYSSAQQPLADPLLNFIRAKHNITDDQHCTVSYSGDAFKSFERGEPFEYTISQYLPGKIVRETYRVPGVNSETGLDQLQLIHRDRGRVYSPETNEVLYLAQPQLIHRENRALFGVKDLLKEIMHYIPQDSEIANLSILSPANKQHHIAQFRKIIDKYVTPETYKRVAAHATNQQPFAPPYQAQLDQFAKTMSEKCPEVIAKKTCSMQLQSKTIEELQTKLEELNKEIKLADQEVMTKKQELGNYLREHRIGHDNQHEQIYNFIKKSASKEVNMQQLLKSNFAYIKTEMIPEIIKLAQARYKAESDLDNLRLKLEAAEYKLQLLEQKEAAEQAAETIATSSDFTTTTPTTSAQAYELMQKHGIELPENLAEAAPEFAQKVNEFAQTNEALEQEIQKIANKPWRETVHDIRMIVENAVVKATQTIVAAAQHDDWMEARECAEGLGKLEEFEQRMGELIKLQNKFIELAINRTCNPFERWLSDPKKAAEDFGNGIVNMGKLAAYQYIQTQQVQHAYWLISYGKHEEGHALLDT